MNTLIVYESYYGNTERIAQVIADTLKAFGKVQAIHVNQAKAMSLAGVDLLIMGCPTQGFRPTPAMTSFSESISAQQPEGLAAACFDTRFRGSLWKRSAAPRLDKQLCSIGIESILPPESFFVKTWRKEGPLLDGETERAARWALQIQRQYEKRRATAII